MFKSIQQKLKDAAILEENEPILSFIPVIDYLKQQQQFKKILKEEIASILPNTKQYYFLASIKNADNDSTPIIYLLKLNEKTNEFKPKVTYYLNDLKSITKIDDKLKQTGSNGQQLVTDIYAFELLFRTDNDDKADQQNVDQKFRFVWQCNKLEERNDFLDTLWKLSEQFLKSNERPKFINYQFEKKKPEMERHDPAQRKNSIFEAQNSDANQYQINRSDEDSLLKLMSECNFVSSNAEKFVEKLQTELLDLDTSNIESIMNSEENTLKLIEMLDAAVDEIDKIDKRLKEYEDKISSVGDAVRIVGERDNVIQLQQNNQHALLEVLENMISSIEYPNEYKAILAECDLSSPQRVQRCVTAANMLLDVLETDLPLGLKKMKSFEEQKKLLESLKLKFCLNSSNHLRNAIGHATNKHIDTYKIVDNSLNLLPIHKQIFDDLYSYRDLMPWMHRSGCSFNDQTQHKTYFTDVKQHYVETVKQLYLREIVPFCYCARAKIVKNDRTKTTASMDNLRGQLIRSTDKAHFPGGDFLSIKVDQPTKETLKLVFIKLLNQLSNAVQAEQQFCQDFFRTCKNDDSNSISANNNNNQNNNNLTNSTTSANNHLTANNQQNPQLSRHPSEASINSNSTSTSKQIVESNKNDTVMLTEIFSNVIEEQVKQIMDAIVRTESMMVMFLYSDLLARVLTSHSSKSFMHQPLVGLLRFAKERCDDYCNTFKDIIREHRVNKKEKIGILRYVLYFEEFVKESEVCWEPIKKDMYEKLCIIYQSLVNEIFKGIEAIALESQKTPPDVVRFQNYQYMNHIMRSINGLKDSTKYARDQYVQWKASYIREYFGQPLEKIANFFDKVDAKIERGYKHEDITYQLELSPNNLRDIIKEYPAREVKRGLDNLFNRVCKHLVENSSLLEVVWRDMSNEFIKQYKNYQYLIEKCYSGQKITFEFTEQDICKFFEDIAQTH